MLLHQEPGHILIETSYCNYTLEQDLKCMVASSPLANGKFQMMDNFPFDIQGLTSRDANTVSLNEACLLSCATYWNTSK
jgi:hypothetical protein